MGDLVTPILKGVPDTKKLGERSLGLSPLSKLVQAYKTKAKQDDTLPVINRNSTGADLKVAIRKMDAIDQVTLLYSYTQTVYGKSPLAFGPADDEEEERNFNRLAKKILFYAFAPIPCLIAGAVIIQGWHTGVFGSGVVVDGLLSTSSEVLQLIFEGH